MYLSNGSLTRFFLLSNARVSSYNKDEFMTTAGEFAAQFFIQTWFLRRKRGLQPPKDRRCVDFTRLVIMCCDLARLGDYELLTNLWICVLHRYTRERWFVPLTTVHPASTFRSANCDILGLSVRSRLLYVGIYSVWKKNAQAGGETSSER